MVWYMRVHRSTNIYIYICIHIYIYIFICMNISIVAPLALESRGARSLPGLAGTF